MIAAALAISAPIASAQTGIEVVKDAATGEPCGEVTLYDGDGQPAGWNPATYATNAVDIEGGCELGPKSGVTPMSIGGYYSCTTNGADAVHVDSAGMVYIEKPYLQGQICTSSLTCRDAGGTEELAWLGQMVANGQGGVAAALFPCIWGSGQQHWEIITVDVASDGGEFEQFGGNFMEIDGLNWEPSGGGGTALDIELAQ